MKSISNTLMFQIRESVRWWGFVIRRSRKWNSDIIRRYPTLSDEVVRMRETRSWTCASTHAQIPVRGWFNHGRTWILNRIVSWLFALNLYFISEKNNYNCWNLFLFVIFGIHIWHYIFSSGKFQLFKKSRQIFTCNMSKWPQLKEDST